MGGREVCKVNLGLGSRRMNGSFRRSMGVLELGRWKMGKLVSWGKGGEEEEGDVIVVEGMMTGSM